MAYPVMPFGFLGSQGDNDAYIIQRSLRFNSGDSANLNRTLTTPTNNKIFTYSCWVKSNGSTARQPIFVAINGGATSLFGIEFAVTTQTLLLWDSNYSNAAPALTTSQVFRDPSAWYHIVMSVDTTQATASNRTRLYVNGSQITAFSSENYAAQNSSPYMNSAVSHSIGSWVPGVAAYASLYMTELNFIDGQALTPASFGETDSSTGRWKAKAYSGTYGINGFYLNFADNSGITATTLGKDSSGNGNNWTPNNLSVTAGADNDSLVDSPTDYGTDSYSTSVNNARGNYCTLNPLQSSAILSNGNLNATASTASWRSAIGSIGASNGKYYYEIRINALSNSAYILPGVGNLETLTPANLAAGNGYPGQNINSWGIQFGTVTYKYYNNVATTITSVSIAVGDIIQVAFEVSAGTSTGKLWFGKNNVWLESGNPSAGTSPLHSNLTGIIAPHVGVYTSAESFSVNFGQRPFIYAAPTGFKTLCTTNLPTPTIKNSKTCMDVVTFTATGANQSITGLNFSPDLVWIKNRATWAGNRHTLYDTTRTLGQRLDSSTTEAEAADNDLITFDSNGFSGNYSGTTYVAWNWKKSPIAGMDIVGYTGTGSNMTISHSLGVTPKMIINKLRSGIGGWPVYHASLGNTGAVQLESTGAFNVSSTYWNNTSPTSSNFTVASGLAVNGATYINYVFAEIEGYSKFGSYVGNGSTDGPFVYCGFRPRWVMIKNSSSGYNWIVYDTARNTQNLVTLKLAPNNSQEENGSNVGGVTFNTMDILSSGFKLRSANVDSNASGNTIIFAAFAESPFKYSRAR